VIGISRLVGKLVGRFNTVEHSHHLRGSQPWFPRQVMVPGAARMLFHPTRIACAAVVKSAAVVDTWLLA
jgi:hypothetical protein